MPYYINCSSEGLAPQMHKFIKEFEIRLGEKLTITSAYRTKEHEIEKKRSGLSAHCKGLAIDVACHTSNIRFNIIQIALSLHCYRIGIHKDFIHLDLCDWSHGKTPECIWLYD